MILKRVKQGLSLKGPLPSTKGRWPLKKAAAVSVFRPLSLTEGWRKKGCTSVIVRPGQLLWLYLHSQLSRVWGRKIHEFEANLGYSGNFRAAWASQWAQTVSKKNKITRPEIVLIHCLKKQKTTSQIFVRLFQNDGVQKLTNSKISCVSYKKQNQVCLESRL